MNTIETITLDRDAHGVITGMARRREYELIALERAAVGFPVVTFPSLKSEAPVMCVYCGGNQWRINFREQRECVGCAAPMPEVVPPVSVPIVYLTDAEYDWAYAGTYAGQVDEFCNRVDELKQELVTQFLPILQPLVDRVAVWLARV